jgi:peptidoglycan biosynthesis protein MviN/MurJ (putative lipid II flippase)
MSRMSMTVMAAEEHEVSQLLSWGIGIGILVILVLMMVALVAFGGGREHS